MGVLLLDSVPAASSATAAAAVAAAAFSAFAGVCITATLASDAFAPFQQIIRRK